MNKMIRELLLVIFATSLSGVLNKYLLNIFDNALFLMVLMLLFLAIVIKTYWLTLVFSLIPKKACTFTWDCMIIGSPLDLGKYKIRVTDISGGHDKYAVFDLLDGNDAVIDIFKINENETQKLKKPLELILVKVTETMGTVLSNKQVKVEIKEISNPSLFEIIKSYFSKKKNM